MTKRRRVNEKQSDSKITRKRTSSHQSNSSDSNQVDVISNHNNNNNSNIRSSQSKSSLKGKGSLLAPPSLRSVWLFSCGVRIAWTLYGQNGYIHPDEFFQGPEVVAGDVFGLKVTKTWEFTSEPIRSMLPPSITIGLPYLFLRFLQKWHGLDLIDAHWLLVAPRLAYCFLSFIIDFCLYRIASLCKLQTYSILTAFSTSYIALVFYVRTLSNTLESVFFALILLVVVSTRINNSSGLSSKPDSNRSSSPPFLPSPFAGALPLSLILVGGFFNRPTFAAFAFIPTIFWLIDSCFPLRHHLSRRYIIVRLISLVPGAIILSFVFVLFDSLYYGSLSVDQLFRFFRDPADAKDLFNVGVVITPFNFLLYNFDSGNLSSHGRHPFYTHLFNSFLLYGVIAVLFFVSIYHKYRGSSPSLSSSSSSTRSQSNLLTLSYLFPLVFLSLFAHQEPRFLIPLLAPLCLLHSDLLFGPKASRLLTFTWFFWGLLGSVLFGVLHQGGVVPSLTYLSKTIHSSSDFTDSSVAANSSYGCPAKILFYKTYMPPQHLLALPGLKPTTTTATTAKDTSKSTLASFEQPRCPELHLSDLKGCAQPVLASALRDIKQELAGGGRGGGGGGRGGGGGKDGVNGLLGSGDVIFVAPVSVIRETICHRGIKIALMKTFFPHLSMETPPGFSSFFPPVGEEEEEEEKKVDDEQNRDGCRLIKNSRDKTFTQRLKLAFSLAVVKVDISTVA